MGSAKKWKRGQVGSPLISRTPQNGDNPRTEVFDAKASTIHRGVQTEAIRLMKTSTKPATALARELDVPRNRLYKWAQDAEKKGDRAFQGSGRPKASTDELSVLERENARLKEENEILKKAATYFARELP